jgi:hypothetical protein
MRSRVSAVPNLFFSVAILFCLSMFPLSATVKAQDHIVVERSATLVVETSEVCFSELILCPALEESGGSNASNAATPPDFSGYPTSAQNSSNAENNDSLANGPHDWVHKWLAAQPHYVAPLVTTHVDLVEQFRWDSSWQTNAGGSQTANYGNSKGLEIIPTTFLEVQVAPPPYLSHSGTTPDGFGDLSMFFKYRIASATEGEGDYFVGAFMGVSIPTGTPPNGMGHTILTPMFAFAKGWPGYFSVQNNFAGNLPTSGAKHAGPAIRLEYYFAGLWHQEIHLARSRTELHVLLGWSRLREERDLHYARHYLGVLSARREAAHRGRRGHSDRGDAFSHLQPQMGMLCASTVLRADLGDALGLRQGRCQALQIPWVHTYDSEAWAVDVGNQKERNA